MSINQHLREEAVKLLREATKLKGEEIESLLEKPPENIGADVAFPCFVLAKKLRKNPAEIAKDISGKIKAKAPFREVSFYGPYVNFFGDWEKLSGKLMKEVIRKDAKYGSSPPMKEKVMVEYSAPNTNKPLHLGHLRNDAIGMSVSNILASSGRKVVRANLYSNRGAHICKSMLAYQKWGKGKKPDIKPDHFVGKFYVMFEQKKNDDMEKGIRGMLIKWEENDKETRALWKKMDTWAVEGFHETYKRFGSVFDTEFRESDFYDKAKPVIEKGLRKGVFVKDRDGSIIADLEKDGLSKKVVMRADGTSIYLTNDLALTKHKFERFSLDRALWVVGSEQNLYFQQLFRIMEKLGFPWANGCHHLTFGLVYLPEGKMKSREGKVVDADNIIDEMISLAAKEVSKREKLPGKELAERSRMIGLGALKYFLLKMDTVKDIHFDPNETISFEGDTGPYIQYSHARACSILRKVKPPREFDASLLKDKHELGLIKKISELPDAVNIAARDLKPHYMTTYAFELATKFNEFYQHVPVIASEPKARPARIALVEAARISLRNALALLNIEAPEKM